MLNKLLKRETFQPKKTSSINEEIFNKEDLIKNSNQNIEDDSTIDNIDYLKVSKNTGSTEDNINKNDSTKVHSIEKTDEYYLEIKNPKTGLRYSIPGLDRTSPTYFREYVYYMKLKETNEEAFLKLLNWD